MKCGSIFLLIVLSMLAGAGEKEKPEEFPPRPPIKYLSPDEELKTITLPEGYRLELVLDETSIKEPVVCAFDGNGRLYVCEMRSYMQDIDATDEHKPVGVVSRHESTKGDGVYDKHAVFVDKLLLPRMVLPLDERVLINETDTNDVVMYQDTNGDGVSDKKEIWFAGGKRGGNLEHQQSGLVWCQDNWIYQSTNSFRLRWTGAGKEPLKENTPGNGGQWGLGQDDYGKMWFCNAGGEKGHVNFQIPIIYGALEFPKQQPPDYLEVYPQVALGDVQGGHGRHRPDLTLNHMTASCGNEIVRVDRLPEDIRGDALIGEPVGRLIRRSKVEDREGLTYIHNALDKKEFIVSTDPNFRPINIANGPDGCMYIVDMYRGIIQEGAWTNKGSYLRKVIQQHSLDKNAGRGRIWRLTHMDFKPGPQPHMLDETPAQLVAHFEHPNGWWRETAQKLLVVKGDKSVVPALTTMLKSSKNPLARIHALWTLEGLQALDADLISAAMKDANAHVRAAAIRAGEPLFKSTPALFEQMKALGSDPDPNVIIQTVTSAKYLKAPDWIKMANAAMQTSKFEGVKAIVGALLNAGPTFDRKKFNKVEIARLEQGETVFRELCFACHGFDGKGMSKDMAPQGVTITAKTTGTTIAPPLSGSTTVSDRDTFLRVLMKGMNGPVGGKTYDAQMLPMESNADEWIADVASYVRNSFGNHGSMVNWMDVSKIRSELKDRTAVWTSDELVKFLPKLVAHREKWKLSASHGGAKLKAALDNDMSTRWDTGIDQAPGMWFQIELPELTEVARIVLNATGSNSDYPRGYKVEVSTNGKDWGKSIAEGKGTTALTEIEFPAVKAKFIKITQTGSVKGLFWSIHEFALYPPNAPKEKEETPKKRLLAITVAMDDRAAANQAAEKVLNEMSTHTGLFALDVIHSPGKRTAENEAKWMEAVKKALAQKFSAGELKKYDGVIFANTSGELPIPDTQALSDWVKSGKAFIGLHGAADTLHGNKPYIEMLGGEYEGHAWKEPVTLRIEDRKHPLSAVFPTRFEFTDEIYQFKNWSRDALHTVISVHQLNEKREKVDGKEFFERGTRPDKDYGVAWVKEFGQGKVFYTTLGGSAEVWQDPKYQQHVFGGIKWALGE